MSLAYVQELITDIYVNVIPQIHARINNIQKSQRKPNSDLDIDIDELVSLIESKLESNSGSGSGGGIDQSVIDDLNSKIETIQADLESGDFCRLNSIITKEELSGIFGTPNVPERTYKEWIFMLISALVDVDGRFSTLETNIGRALTETQDNVEESLSKVQKNIDIITAVDQSRQDKLFVSHADGSLGMILALALDDNSQTHKLAPIHGNQFLRSYVSTSIPYEENYGYQYICDTVWLCCNDGSRIYTICDANHLNPNFNKEEVKTIHYVSDINEFSFDYRRAFQNIATLFPNVEYFYFDCPNVLTFSMISPACYFSKLIYHNFPINTVKLSDNIFNDESYPLLNTTFAFDYPDSIRTLLHCDLSYPPSKTDLKVPPNLETSEGTTIHIPSECKTLYVDKAMSNAWQSIKLRVPDTNNLKSIILAEGITKTPKAMFYSLSDSMTDHSINVTLPTSLNCLNSYAIEYNGNFPNSVLNYYVGTEKLMKTVENKTVVDLSLLYNLDTLSTNSIDLFSVSSTIGLEIIIPDSVTKITNDSNSDYIFDLAYLNTTIHIPSSIKEVVPNATLLNYRSTSAAYKLTIKYHYKTGEDYTTNAFYQWLTTLNSSIHTIELIEDN